MNNIEVTVSEDTSNSSYNWSFLLRLNGYIILSLNYGRLSYITSGSTTPIKITYNSKSTNISFSKISDTATDSATQLSYSFVKGYYHIN